MTARHFRPFSYPLTSAFTSTAACVAASVVSMAALTALSLLLGGCSGMSRQGENTAVGAGVGAIGGAILTGGSAAGTLGGAAVGGVIGHEVGK